MDDVDNLAGELLDFAKSLIPREPGESYDAWMKRAESLAGAIVDMNAEAQLPENWWDDAKAKYPRESTESYDQWQDRARGLAQMELNGDVVGLAKSLAEGQKRVQDSNEPWKEVGNIVDALKKSLGTYEWSTMTCDEQNALIDAVSKQIQKDFFEGQAALAAALDALKNPITAPSPPSTPDKPAGPIKVTDQTGIKEYGSSKQIADANKLLTDKTADRGWGDTNPQAAPDEFEQQGPNPYSLEPKQLIAEPMKIGESAGRNGDGSQSYGLQSLPASGIKESDAFNLLGENIQPIGGTQQANVNTKDFYKATVITTHSIDNNSSSTDGGAKQTTETVGSPTGMVKGDSNLLGNISPDAKGGTPGNDSGNYNPYYGSGNTGAGLAGPVKGQPLQIDNKNNTPAYTTDGDQNIDVGGVVGGFGNFIGGVQQQQQSPTSGGTQAKQGTGNVSLSGGSDNRTGNDSSPQDQQLQLQNQVVQTGEAISNKIGENVGSISNVVQNGLDSVSKFGSTVQQIGNEIGKQLTGAVQAGANYIKETQELAGQNQMSPFGEPAAGGSDLWENKISTGQGTPDKQPTIENPSTPDNSTGSNHVDQALKAYQDFGNTLGDTLGSIAKGYQGEIDSKYDPSGKNSASESDQAKYQLLKSIGQVASIEAGPHLDVQGAGEALLGQGIDALKGQSVLQGPQNPNQPNSNNNNIEAQHFTGDYETQIGENQGNNFKYLAEDAGSSENAINEITKNETIKGLLTNPLGDNFQAGVNAISQGISDAAAKVNDAGQAGLDALSKEASNLQQIGTQTGNDLSKAIDNGIKQAQALSAHIVAGEKSEGQFIMEPTLGTYDSTGTTQPPSNPTNNPSPKEQPHQNLMSMFGEQGAAAGTLWDKSQPPSSSQDTGEEQLFRDEGFDLLHQAPPGSDFAKLIETGKDVVIKMTNEGKRLDTPNEGNLERMNTSFRDLFKTGNVLDFLTTQPKTCILGCMGQAATLKPVYDGMVKDGIVSGNLKVETQHQGVHEFLKISSPNPKSPDLIADPWNNTFVTIPKGSTYSIDLAGNPWYTPAGSMIPQSIPPTPTSTEPPVSASVPDMYMPHHPPSVKNETRFASFKPNNDIQSPKHAERLIQRASSSWNNTDAEPILLAAATPTTAITPALETVAENAVAGLVSAASCAYRIELSNGTLNVPKGGCVFVRDRGRDVGIYVFEKSGRGDITYESNQKHITTLKPGRFLVVTSGKDVTVADANPVFNFGLRGVEEIPLGKDYKAYTGDFSIFAACAELPYIRDMLKSKNSAERRMAQGILKNVAILGHITAMDGPYKQMR